MNRITTGITCLIVLCIHILVCFTFCSVYDTTENDIIQYLHSIHMVHMYCYHIRTRSLSKWTSKASLASSGRGAYGLLVARELQNQLPATDLWRLPVCCQV